MDYLSKASILLCCCFLLLADGQYATDSFDLNDGNNGIKNGFSNKSSTEYPFHSNQESVTLKNKKSKINSMNYIQNHEHLLQNNTSFAIKRERRAVAFGSRLNGRTYSNASASTIRPKLNGVKSQNRRFSTEKPVSVELFNSYEDESRQKSYKKLKSQLHEMQLKEENVTPSDSTISSKEVTASIEYSSSLSPTYESRQSTYGIGRRFIPKHGVIRQSKPVFVPSTISSDTTLSKSEIFPTNAKEKYSSDIHLQDEWLLTNSSELRNKFNTPLNHIRTRTNQQRLNKLNSASNSESLSLESDASEITYSRNDENIAEKANDDAFSNLSKIKITRLTKRPFNKLNSNIQNISPPKSSHEHSSELIGEGGNFSHIDKSLEQEFDIFEKLNNKSDERVSKEKAKGYTPSSLRRRKTRLTKRPFNKFTLDLQNIPDSNTSGIFSADISEDQSLRKFEDSSKQSTHFPKTELKEEASKRTEIFFSDKKETNKVNDHLNTFFTSSRLKGSKFTRRPSNKLNRSRQGTSVAKGTKITKKENSHEETIEIRPSQWAQTESLESAKYVTVNSENVDGIQVETPIPSNRKRGKKRRPSHKLNINPQTSKVSNSPRNTDFREEVNENQPQISNKQSNFDEYKTSKSSQTGLNSKHFDDSIYRNRQQTPFNTNPQRTNKLTKPTNRFNGTLHNIIRSNPPQPAFVAEKQNLKTFEDLHEALPSKTHQISNAPSNPSTRQSDEMFGARSVPPFHSYRENGAKNNRRPSNKKSTLSTGRRTDIAQKHFTSKPIDNEETFAYENGDPVEPFIPSRSPKFPVNNLQQGSSESDTERFTESKLRRGTNSKLNAAYQHDIQEPTLNRKTESFIFDKPDTFLPSTNPTPIVRPRYKRPNSQHGISPINRNEQFEPYPTSIKRIPYNFRPTSRTAGTQTQFIDLPQAYNGTQNMLKRYKNAKTTPIDRRTKQPGQHTEEVSSSNTVFTEKPESTELQYEPEEFSYTSFKEQSPLITTESPFYMKHSFSRNKADISAHIDTKVINGVLTETTPNYQQELTTEGIEPNNKYVPTLSPEETNSELLYYPDNYSSKPNADYPLGFSILSNNTQDPLEPLNQEFYYSQITERPINTLEKRYTFPSTSLLKVTELPLNVEPKQSQKGRNQTVQHDSHHFDSNSDEASVNTDTATNDSFIYLPNIKQNSPSQAFSSVSFKYPTLSKNIPTEQKNSLTLSKPFISSPLSTIFDTSSENGQYYHYVMNLGQMPSNKGIAKTKVYSNGNALYTMLHEDNVKSQSFPFGYGHFALQNEKDFSSEFNDQKLMNDIKSFNDSKANFVLEQNVFNLRSNSTDLSQNSTNKIGNSLNGGKKYTNNFHDMIQEANFTEIIPIDDVTTQSIETKFLSANSKLDSIPSFLESIFNNDPANQTKEEQSSTLSILADIFETVTDTNESLSQSSVTEIPTASSFAPNTIGNSFQSGPLVTSHSQDEKVTQNYLAADNSLSYITVSETSADAASTFDNSDKLDNPNLERIYLFAKRNGSLSVGNKSYKLDLYKLLSMLKEKSSALQLTTKIEHETTPTSLFYDRFMETSTFLPVTTENSRTYTHLYAEDYKSDIKKITDIINENAIPVTNSYFNDDNAENITVVTELITSLAKVKSSSASRFQLPFDSSNNESIEKVISSDLSEVTEPTIVSADVSDDFSKHPMLELVIKNSSIENFISKLNRIPVVIRVFNPISQSYHSVLITPEDKISEDSLFDGKDNHDSPSNSEKSSDRNSKITDSKSIQEDFKPIPDSNNRISVADPTLSPAVYFDNILPNKSSVNDIDNIPLTTNKNNSSYSVTPSQPERKLISIDELKELIMKSVDQKANINRISSFTNNNEDATSVPPTQPERKLISINELKELLMKSVDQNANPLSPPRDHDKEVSNDKIPIIDVGQNINEKFPMFAKKSSFPIEMENISPEDISISISESVVINPEPEKDNKSDAQGKELLKTDQVPLNNSEFRQPEMNMSILQNVDDPIKMVFSIMETYKPPKEVTMWKVEAFPAGEPVLESVMKEDFQSSNRKLSDERYVHKNETSFVVPLRAESIMGSESLDESNYPSFKDYLPMNDGSYANDDKRLHLIPIFFEREGNESPAESQRVYEFQKFNGDLKRIHPHSKTYNNKLSRSRPHPRTSDRVSYNTDFKDLSSTVRNGKNNHQQNGEFENVGKMHRVQDYGTYLQYSNIGPSRGKSAPKSKKNLPSKVVETDIHRNRRTGSLPQPFNSSSSSNNLPEYSDDNQIFNLQYTGKIDEQNSKHSNSDNLDEFQESRILPDVLAGEESNNHQQIIDINSEAVDSLVFQYPLRNVPQHHRTSTLIHTSFQNDEENNYHTVVAKNDSHQKSSEKINKSYHRTLPQYITPDITERDSFSVQIPYGTTSKNKSTTSEAYYSNDKDLLQHTANNTQLQKSSSNWDDVESAVKHIKVISYVEPKRKKQTTNDLDSSSASNQFILLDDRVAAIDRPSNQQNRGAQKPDENIFDVDEKPLKDMSPYDDSDYMYPIFKTDR